MKTTQSGSPHDGTTLTEVLDGYAQAGFSGTFTTGENATIECNTCDTISQASGVQMSSLRRLEGASDPDDMMSVVAITCPNCSTKGVLVLGYGPNATAEDSDISRALQDFRHDDELTGNSAPGEAAGDSADVVVVDASRTDTGDAGPAQSDSVLPDGDTTDRTLSR